MKLFLTKSQRIVLAFGVWAALSLAILAAIDKGVLAYYFVLCFLGFLIIADLSGPFMCQPPWRTRVNLVIKAGMLVFCLAAGNAMLNMMGISL